MGKMKQVYTELQEAQNAPLDFEQAASLVRWLSHSLEPEDDEIGCE